MRTGLGAVEVKLDSLAPKKARKTGGRRPLPAHLERIEEIIEPEATPCSCGVCARVKIGADVSERLDVVAPKFRVIVMRVQTSGKPDQAVQDPALLRSRLVPLDARQSGPPCLAHRPLADAHGARHHSGAARAGERRVSTLRLRLLKIAARVFENSDPCATCLCRRLSRSQPLRSLPAALPMSSGP